MTRLDRSSASIAGHRVIKANEPQPRIHDDRNKNHLKSMVKEAMALADFQQERGCWLYLKLAYSALNREDLSQS